MGAGFGGGALLAAPSGALAVGEADAAPTGWYGLGGGSGLCGTNNGGLAQPSMKTAPLAHQKRDRGERTAREHSSKW